MNVGNTNTVLGVFRGDELQWQWRMSTQAERTADELAVLLGGLLDQADLSFTSQITGVVISSVVPTSTPSSRTCSSPMRGAGSTVPGVARRSTRLERRFVDGWEVSRVRAVNCLRGRQQPAADLRL